MVKVDHFFIIWLFSRIISQYWRYLWLLRPVLTQQEPQENKSVIQVVIHFEPSTKKVGPGTIKLHFFTSNRPFSPLFTPYLHLCSSQSKTEVSFALFGVGLTYFRHFWKKKFFVGLAAVTLLYTMDKIENYNFICTVCTIFSIIWLATTRPTISKFSRRDFEMEKHCKENTLLTWKPSLPAI